jgi:peptidoglycan/LPS O-acetylase OafA/YrhL
VLLLYLAKTTFLQFYNPDFMRSFGDGVLNGSLWTICVELQFYFLVPIIYWLAVSKNRARSNVHLIALMLVSMACNRLLYAMESQHAHEVAWKLAKISFVPWVYMFLCGMLIQRNFGFFSRVISNRNAVVTLVAYVLLALVLTRRGVPLGNNVSPFLFFPLVAALMMAAYTIPSASNALLKGNDISYGLYIYHQPVVNTFLFFSMAGAIVSALTLLISLALAILSWIIIERPFLRRKRHPSHVVGGSGRAS